jgi:hypothetical protein
MNQHDNKLALILERSGENLGVTKDGNETVLEGIFAQFGVVNNNDRIYEENEYLPHLDYLQKKITKKGLLGELDHPEKFDIALSKVSHIVEKLEYDKEKRQLKGRVRLLDTPSGRIATALVESGVPISISSRAAGLVEPNKHVKIKKIFTYDLVADPGFENAVLNKMNESLGILNENVLVYDVSSKYPELLEDFNHENDMTNDKKPNPATTMEYVTSEELNTYSLILKEEIEAIHKKMSTISENSEMASKLSEMSESVVKMQSYIDYLTNTIDSNVKYGEYVAEKLNQVIDYSNYVAKTLDESIDFSKEVSEKSDKSIKYAEYLKEQIEKGISYSEYLKECIERGVSYTEYVAEKVDTGILYSEHIAEQANKGIEYTEYVAEQANKGIEYTEYVAENANKINEKLDDAVSYSEYIGESLNKGIAYSEYVGEQTQSLADYTEFMMNENVVTPKTPKFTEKISSTEYSTLSGKVDEMIASIKKQKVDDADNTLDEARKQKVSQALNEANSKTTNSAIKNLLGNSQVEVAEDKWLTDAPEEFKTLWESLDVQVKNTINAQSKLYKLESPYQIKNFWETRKLTPGNTVNMLTESKETATVLPSLGYNSDYLDSIKATLDKFRK